MKKYSVKNYHIPLHNIIQNFKFQAGVFEDRYTATIPSKSDFALMPLVNEEYNVRRCVKRIIDVYADDDTTIFAIYGNQTKGNFLPHPIQNPIININVDTKIYNVDYQTRKELVIIDSESADLFIMKELGFFDDSNILRRKFVWIWSLRTKFMIQPFFEHFWKFDILDAMFLVYDYDLKSNFTEVISSDKHHPMNRCGAVVNNISRFSCDQIKKNKKQNFFRNYSKCRLTFLYDRLYKEHKIEMFFINQFVVVTLAATLNLNLFAKRHRHEAITDDDNYLLTLQSFGNCGQKGMFCGKLFIERVNGWTVPSPKKLGSLQVFELIYKWDSWIFIVLSFVVTCFVWWIISLCRWSTRFSSSILDVYSITITGAVDKVPRCLSLCCLFLTYVIYAIHIQTGFTSNLVTLLTVPQYDVIKTAQELADSSLPLLISTSINNVILGMTHEGDDTFKKMKKKMIVLSIEEWQEALVNEQILENSSIMVTSDMLHAAFQKLHRKINFIPYETVKNELHGFNTKSGCLLIEDANKVVNALVESGIIERQKEIYKKIEMDIFKNGVTQDSTEPVVLALEHIYPAFVFWIVGMFVATFVFFLEHANYIVRNK